MSDALANRMQDLLLELGTRFDDMVERLRRADQRADRAEADLRAAQARAAELQREVARLRQATVDRIGAGRWGLA